MTLKSNLTISIFSSIIVTILALVYWIARLGFETDSFLILKTLSFSYLVLFFPVLINWILNRYSLSIRNPFWKEDPFIALLFLASVLVIGILDLSSKYLIACITISGILLYIFSWITFLRIIKNKHKAIIFYSSAVLLSLWIVGIAWGSGYNNPLFLEKLIIHKSHIDTLFHAAISNMIKTYGVASTGLDGVPFLAYHFGSHWIFAQLSTVLNMPVIDFYQIGFQLIFIPLLIKYILYLSMQLRVFYDVNSEENDILSDKFLWIILVCVFVGLLPARILDKFAIWNSIIIGESYAVSMILFLILISLTLEAYRTKSKLFFVIIFPLIFGVIGALKISTVSLLLALAVYTFFRLNLYKNFKFIICLCSIIMIAWFERQWFNASSNKIIIDYFNFITEYIMRNKISNSIRIPLFFLIYFFIAWIFIAFRLRKIKVRNLTEFFKAFKGKVLLDVEIVTVCCVAGIMPGLLLEIPGGGAAYFSDIQIWIALVFLLASCSGLQFQNVFRNTKVRRVGYVVLFFSIFNITSSFCGFIADNVQERYHMVNNEIYQKHSRVSFKGIKQSMINFKEQIEIVIYYPQQVLIRKPEYNLIRNLRDFEQTSKSMKRQSLIYVPKSNEVYWGMLPKRLVPFIAPAISGCAAIYGLPLPNCAEAKYYGYDIYGPRSQWSNEIKVDVKDLYSTVLKKGFKKVGVFNGNGKAVIIDNLD